ncbi:neurophysin 1-like [Chrysoperla carnea]|uniref:neurophysin 1-like n=1 Tax=Chrysoperla carnea TaxID=189513 RepID=UPI001D07C34B|nr:neurophysin 1-like [Chrysoperla carnea]
MNNSLKATIVTFVIFTTLVHSCLITNCPRGGKRSNLLDNRISTDSIKPCTSCGPQLAGQCFGPSICCGPFGCLIKTLDTIRCQRNGGFHEQTPCIAGRSTCDGNAGRCALNGICCSQESCFKDSSCNEDLDNENMAPLNGLFQLLNPVQRARAETLDKL